MWLELSVAVSASFVFSKAASNLCLSRLREWQLQPSSHHKSIAITVCWLEHLSISWIAWIVLNAAAGLLCNWRKYDHVTPILRDVLHWLPVPLRVEFKICLLFYKSLHGSAPGAFVPYGATSSIDG